MTQPQMIDAGMKRLGTQLVLGVQVYLRALRTYPCYLRALAACM